MDIESAYKRYQHGEISTPEIVGDGDGNLYITFFQMGMVIVVTNSTTPSIKTFRSPKWVIQYLRKHNFKEFKTNLEHWNPNKIFDTHKRAHALKRNRLEGNIA